MTKRQPQNQTPAFCNYDNSTYQEDFWGGGKQAYEDAAEAMGSFICFLAGRNNGAESAEKIGRAHV